MIKRIKVKRKSPFSVGDKVMLDTSKIVDRTTYNRKFSPEDGTIGTVVLARVGSPIVQWPKGSTSSDDRWGCPSHWLKKVE